MCPGHVPTQSHQTLQQPHGVGTITTPFYRWAGVQQRRKIVQCSRSMLELNLTLSLDLSLKPYGRRFSCCLHGVGGGVSEGPESFLLPRVPSTCH